MFVFVLLSHLLHPTQLHFHQLAFTHKCTNTPTQAFDIALMEAIADGTVDSILDAHGIPTTERVRDCSSLANTWPTVPREVLADARTTFGSVFAHGSVRLCARTIDEGSRGRYIPNNVSGSLPAIERDLARRIGAHYNYTGTLGVQYVWFESSEEVMPALDAGECDATYALIAVGGFSGGLRRSEKWRPSCSVLGDVVTLYVSAASPARTLDAFLALHDSPAIGTVGLSALQFCPQLIIDAKTVSFTSDAAALEALSNGTIQGILGSPAAAGHDVHPITTPYYITRAAWFRKEQTTAMKVTRQDDLQQYMTGNEDLALTYEAALNAISQQTVTSRIFNRFGISRLDTLVCDPFPMFCSCFTLFMLCCYCHFMDCFHHLQIHQHKHTNTSNPKTELLSISRSVSNSVRVARRDTGAGAAEHEGADRLCARELREPVERDDGRAV